MKFPSITTLVACAVSLASTLALADPPGRVGRVSLIEGAVSFSVGGEGNNDNWQASQLNWPITEGNRLYTDIGARVEVNIGGSALRLTEKTALDFVRFDDQVVSTDLRQGALNLTLKNWQREDDFIITTPTLRVALNQNGRYRIEVSDDGNVSTIIVRQGEAQITNGNSRFNIIAPQQATLSGDDGGQVNIVRANAEDDFERWAADRDRRLDAVYSSRYVAPDTPGLYELDRYGNWRDVDDYGPVWVPSNVAVGWAPYRHGHWDWVAPWGWTWMDEAAWGFAPFHYGRWVYVDNYWAWSPGQRHARPIYAPALVSFISAPGFNVSVNIGQPCGWVPLAPWEAYQPYYQTSPRYVSRINVPHADDGRHRDHHGDYRNRDVPGGVSFVSPDVLLRNLPVARAILPVERNILRDLARIAPPIPLPPLPGIGALLPKHLFARPEVREVPSRLDEPRRDRETWQRPVEKYQPGVAPPPRVTERDRPVGHDDRGERRRPPRPDYQVPRHEVDTRVPLVVAEPPHGAKGSPPPMPMPSNVVRDMRRDRPLPPLPVPSSVSRDTSTAPVQVRERPKGNDDQRSDGRDWRKGMPDVMPAR